MDFAVKIMAMNLVSFAAVIAAFALACTGKDGWGWFLLIALLGARAPKSIPVKKHGREAANNGYPTGGGYSSPAHKNRQPDDEERAKS